MSEIENSSVLHEKQDSVRKNTSKKRRRKPDPGRYMIARLLGLVCLVLVVFEGRVVYTLFTHHVGSDVEVMSSNDGSDSTEGSVAVSSSGSSSDQSDSGTGSADSSGSESSGTQSTVLGLAGAGSSGTDAGSTVESSDSGQVSEVIDSPAVVPLRDTSVDDSYFSNAVFIGDSRMEGFRNSSGITQGTFLTAVGLSINDMDKQIISSSDGTISVYQGLSGRQYDRIYLMLGANDLGYYTWDTFLSKFENVLDQFHMLQPKAMIYVCSVIYVDESKIAAGYEYDNNDNVRTINGYILEACEDLWYSYYLNLNEIFSDGYGSLISDASSDGVHLYAEYLEQMLDYLKNHYITDEEFAEEMAKHPDDIANQSSADETENGTVSESETAPEVSAS